MSIGQRIGLVVVFALAATIFALGILASLSPGAGEPVATTPAPVSGAPAASSPLADAPAGPGRRSAEPAWAGPSGQVLGPDGEPLAGAEVFALDADLDPSRALRAAAAWSADGPEPGAPADDGADVLDRTLSDASGRYQLAIRGDAHAVQVVARAPRAYSPVPTRIVATLDAAEPWPATDLRLARGADLAIVAPAGRLAVRADTREGVLLPMGTPTGERVAVSDGASATRLFGLPPGIPLEIAVDPDDAAPARIWTEPLAAGESRRVTVPTDAGEVFQGRVLDDAGAPLPDAVVEVAWPGLPGRASKALREVTTDARGRFRLDGVPSGELVGRVRAEGFPTLDFWVPPQTHARASGGFELEMGAGARLAGRLVDTDGEPIADARVSVRAETGAYARTVDPTVRAATSDADGRFEVRGLDGRSFLVVAETDRNGVVDRRGVAREVEVGLEHEVVLVPTAALELRAVDREGRPVRTLNVAAQLVDGRSSGQRPGQTLELERRSNDGTYRFEGLQPGDWQLDLTPRDLAPIADLRATVPTDAPLVLVFEEPATVSGRVVDPNGEPITGGRVSAWATRPEGLSYRVRESEATLTDADGRFELRRLRPGRLHLSARHPDFARSTWREFELGPGQRRSGIELTVRRGAGVDGRVLDEKGEPQSGRMVVMHAVEAWDPVRLRTDEDGRFSVDRLVPGEWQILVLGMNEDDPGAASVDQVRLAHVTLVDGDRRVVEIGGAQDDAGRIVARAAWAPAGLSNWAYVRAAAEGSILSQMLDRDGAFEVATAATGRHLVSVVLGKAVERGCELFVTLEARAVGDGAPRVRPVELDEPTGRVHGRVVDAAGEPVAGVGVRLESVGHLVPGARVATRFCLTSTDSDGRFAFDWVTDGSYRLAAGGLMYTEGAPPSARFSVEAVGPLDLTAGEEPAPIEIVLDAPREVSGRVVDGSGRPVARATVYARFADGQHVHDLALVHADADGRFTYGGLPADAALTFSATAPGLASVETAPDAGGEVRLELAPAATLVVEYGIDAGGRLSIRDERDREYAGRGDVRDAARTGGLVWEDGRHVFDDLPIGRYTVELVARDGRRAVKYVQLEAGDERTVALRVLR